LLPGQPEASSRNELLEQYPGATGIKTGFTTPAGYTLVASARRDGRDLVAVVLGAGEDPSRYVGASTRLDHGFEDTRVTEIGTEVGFVMAGGVLRLTVPPTPITIPRESEVVLQPPPLARPPQGP